MSGLRVFTLASAAFLMAQPTVSKAQDSYSSILGPNDLDHLTNANIAMPNGANLAHTIYQSRPAGGSVTVSGSSVQSVFSATGDGSLTIQPVAMFVGARFHAVFGGRGQTGTLNVSTVTGCLKLGSVSLVCGTTLALPASLSAVPFAADVICTVRSVGVSGTMSCKGEMRYATGLSSSSPLMTDLTTTSVATINTTTAQTWDATIQLSSTVGSPSLTIYDAYIIQEN